MKDLKMCSFRLNSNVFTDFKDFCTRNNITIKETLTKCIGLLLEADTIERNTKVLFPNSTTTTTVSE